MTEASSTVQANGIGKRRQCHHCSRTFTKTEHLERHVRSHTKEKPFQCSVCGKNYGRHDTLLRHQKDHLKDSSKPAIVEGADPGVTDSAYVNGNRTTGEILTHTSSVGYVQSAHAIGTSASSLSKSGGNGSLASTEATFANEAIPSSDTFRPAPAVSTWNSEFDAQFPSWLINDDFDIGMLDTPIAATMAELAPGWLNAPRRSSTSEKPITSLKHLWFTRMNDPLPSLPASGAVSPSPPAQVEVDENYRRALHRRLQVRPSDHSLPSSEFLNLCVRLYFARFSPVFPVVHAATFHPSATNSMLLLSICSVGSLFTGSLNACSQGVQIFERLNKAVLATWDRLIARDASEVVPMIQAALIGQTFGLLSGDPTHLATVDSFHGTVISWARRRNMFAARHSPIQVHTLDSETLDLKWKEWARTEELIRIALGLHIHDAELADIFHHESFLRHGTKHLPIAASNALFTASSASEWAAVYTNELSTEYPLYSTPPNPGTPGTHDLENIPLSSRFTVYAALEGVAATIVETRQSGQFDMHQSKNFQETLISFYARYLTSLSPFESDNLGITVLWHLTFMSLCIDFDLLERAVGRDGPVLDGDDLNTIVEWAASPLAKRCIIHASLIQKKLEALSIGFEPAIHVPRAMFLAAVSWYCYTRYGPDGGPNDILTHSPFNFPEMALLEVNPAMLLFEANGFKLGKPAAIEASGALCGLTDLLQRIGHWEIARKFGSILGALIHNEANPNG